MTETVGQATSEAPYCDSFNPNPTPPSFVFPPGSCDTHAHVCGPESEAAYDGARIYTPHDALLPDYEHMLRTLGVERLVLVQPSVYGTDNSVMLKAIRNASMPARGVAVVPFDVDTAELEYLHESGVRGARFNLVDVKNPKAGLPLRQITRIAERVRPFGWHVEFLIHVDDHPDFADLFRDFPTEIVVGHLGYFRPRCPIDHPGFQGLLELAESGRCWVKLTGQYRVTAEEMPYFDIDAHAAALIARAPHRLIWGSDWPHVKIGKAMPDDGPLADVLGRWVADSRLRKRILVDNPARLYGF